MLTSFIQRGIVMIDRCISDVLSQSKPFTIFYTSQVWLLFGLNSYVCVYGNFTKFTAYSTYKALTSLIKIFYYWLCVLLCQPRTDVSPPHLMPSQQTVFFNNALLKFEGVLWHAVQIFNLRVHYHSDFSHCRTQSMYMTPSLTQWSMRTELWLHLPIRTSELSFHHRMVI